MCLPNFMEMNQQILTHPTKKQKCQPCGGVEKKSADHQNQ